MDGRLSQEEVNEKFKDWIAALGDPLIGPAFANHLVHNPSEVDWLFCEQDPCDNPPQVEKTGDSK